MLVQQDRCDYKTETFKEREHVAEEKILTKHPLGKGGRNIDRQKYETVKRAILSALQNKELTHTELFSRLNQILKSTFSGNISWYGETVKLDLEARKIIERTASKPQKYRLKRN
jgi:hypothetical protein